MINRRSINPGGNKNIFVTKKKQTTHDPAAEPIGSSAAVTGVRRRRRSP